MKDIQEIINRCEVIVSSNDKIEYLETINKLGKKVWNNVYDNNGTVAIQSDDLVVVNQANVRTLYRVKPLVQLDMFEPEYGIDDSPKDDTRIIQIILYFDEPEITEFKELAKIAMRAEFTDYTSKANLSDLFLFILKKHYDTKRISNGQTM
jgi:hypothetical protein